MKDNAVRSGTNYTDTKMTLIIRCTSCNTKFAVNKIELGESNTPKFHCSRCDNVFTLNLQERGDSPSHENKEQFQFEFNDPKDFENVDTVTLSKLHDPEDSSYQEDDSKLEISTSKYSGSVIAEDAYEPISDSELHSDLFLDITQIPKAQSDDSSQIQTAMAIPQIEEPMGYESLRSIKTSSPVTDLESPIKQKRITTRKLSRPSSNLVLLILFTLLALPIVTYQLIVSSPSSADSVLLKLRGGAALKLPPDELYIRSSFIKRILLDTGEPVSVISGIIKNDTEYNLKQINIEGILYSSQGGVLKRKSINISASLGRSRIQSLSIDMLEDLQNSSTVKSFMLRPGQENEFTLVIPEGSASKDIKFYATRIYSVLY